MLKITSTLFAATTSTDNLDLTYTTQSKEAEQLMIELNHGYATNDVLTMLPSRS